MNPKKGFLLLEVIISIVIITAGILFIVRSYSSSKNAIEKSRELFEASLLLEKKMWEFEEKGEIEEGEKTGDFEDEEGYSWNMKASRPENSDLNLAVLSVFQTENPLDTSYSVSTYLRNKTEK